jgi:hypothetical protein
VRKRKIKSHYQVRAVCSNFFLPQERHLCNAAAKLSRADCSSSKIVKIVQSPSKNHTLALTARSSKNLNNNEFGTLEGPRGDSFLLHFRDKRNIAVIKRVREFSKNDKCAEKYT